MVENPYFHRTPVRDSRFFFGRTDETRKILTRVARNQPVSVVGPRRIGKTSLLFHLCAPQVKAAHRVSDNHVFIYIDCQVLSGDLTKSDVYHELLENVIEAMPGKHSAEHGPHETMTYLDFRKRLDRIVAPGLQIVFLLDEFEKISDNRQLGRDFFDELRGLGQTGKVVYVTASGKTLADLSFQDSGVLSSPFFNMFSTVWLGFLGPHEVRALIDDLAAMAGFEGFDENDHAFLREIAGPHPFYLQVACSLLFEEKTRTIGSVTPNCERVKRDFAREMRGHFEYTWKHLDEDERRTLRRIGEESPGEVTAEAMERLDRRCIVYRGGIFPPCLAEFVRRQSPRSLSLRQPEEEERLTAGDSVPMLTGEPLRILHLSDLHMEPSADLESMLQPLVADLRDQKDGLGLERLDYLVVSGDLTNHAKPEEFEVARQLLSKLMDRFRLTAERCIVVPGNHDLDWDEKVYTWEPGRRVDVEKLREGTYVKQGKVILLRDEAQYPSRFSKFAEHFYFPFTKKKYPLAFEDQCILPRLTDVRIQFLAMNSSWEIDEFSGNRSSIHPGALSRGLDKADRQIERAKRDGRLPGDAFVLRIAVWHHPVTGNDKIIEDAFLERLQKADFKLCLHGHVHELREDLIGYRHPTRKIHVAGAGSFGAPVYDRPEAVPRLYNVLEVVPDQSRIRVYTRCLRKETGAWGGWPVWHGESSGEWRAYYDINP